MIDRAFARDHVANLYYTFYIDSIISEVHQNKVIMGIRLSRFQGFY